MVENNIWGEIATLIGRAGKDAVDRTQPMNFSFGVVMSVNPLKISTDQKMILTDEFLILTNAVRDHRVFITTHDWETEENKHRHGNGNDGQDTDEVSHNHKILGRKKITIHNGLTIGEKVLLLRAQGGQDYIVIDRVDEIPGMD